VIKLPAGIVELFLKRALSFEGVEDYSAFCVANGLVDASLRGVDSHGIRLFRHYIAAVRGGRINPEPKFLFTNESSGTAILDADHGFGHAAGKMAVQEVKRLAAQNGIGAVSVKNTTHFGAAAYFGQDIAKDDMLGLCFTNSDPLIPPTGSPKPFLGNNPICFTAPLSNEDPFCLDMATSQITFNEVLRLRTTSEVAPAGTGFDHQGIETRDPKRIESLVPTGGYKGYGLSLMVEIFCALLAQMPFGPNVGHMYKDSLAKRRHLSHFFLAIDINRFVEITRFKETLSSLVAELRGQRPVDPKTPVQVAGDPEKKCREHRQKEGIPISADDAKFFDYLSGQHGISWRAGAD